MRNAQRLALTAAVVAGGALLVVGMAIWAAVASAGTAGVLPALLLAAPPPPEFGCGAFLKFLKPDNDDLFLDLCIPALHLFKV